MATIQLSLSAKTDKATLQHEVLIRFFHGRINQRAKTNVFVKQEYWNDDKQTIIIDEVNAQLEKCNAWRIITPEREKQKTELEQLQQELQRKSDHLATIIKLVQDTFQAADKQRLPMINHGW